MLQPNSCTSLRVVQPFDCTVIHFIRPPAMPNDWENAYCLLNAIQTLPMYGKQ